MAIRANEIPNILIARIEHCHPAPALFASTETVDWPEGALTSLIEAGVMHEVGRAEVIVCPGCEWQCHKAVVVRASVDQPTPRAFIMCDEEPRHGRVPVLLSKLDQYATGLPALARFVSGALRLEAPRSATSGTSYLLGHVKGKWGLRSVAVGLEAGDLVFDVGSQREAMGRLLRWDNAGLAVDIKHVERLANRKGRPRSSTLSYQSDRSRQQARKHETRKRDRAIYEGAKSLRQAGGVTWFQIAEAIASTNLGNGLSSARVRRIIHNFLEIERKNLGAKRSKRK